MQCQRDMFVPHRIFISERSKTLHPAEHSPGFVEDGWICLFALTQTDAPFDLDLIMEVLLQAMFQDRDQLPFLY